MPQIPTMQQDNQIIAKSENPDPAALGKESSLILEHTEDPSGYSREGLEGRYLDLKDEALSLRRLLGLNPKTGKTTEGGSYATPGGFLRKQKVAVFVDVQNMYHSAKNIYGRSLSFAKMLRECVRTRQLVRSIAYVIDHEGVDQTKFLKSLGYIGCEIRHREVMKRNDGTKKAEWEVGIAVDMLRIAEKVDVVILASGNGAFADMIPLIQAKGVRVECCAFKGSVGWHLENMVDQCHFLTQEHLYRKG
ncbi:MAG: hypothetical protein COA70_04770 [Planctomycetota bacterium]|nr:MAG: hypothetical protein COA70_04770 [Planctomycetota bacterium]